MWVREPLDVRGMETHCSEVDPAIVRFHHIRAISSFRDLLPQAVLTLIFTLLGSDNTDITSWTDTDLHTHIHYRF